MLNSTQDDKLTPDLIGLGIGFACKSFKTFWISLF